MKELLKKVFNHNLLGLEIIVIGTFINFLVQIVANQKLVFGLLYLAVYACIALSILLLRAYLNDETIRIGTPMVVVEYSEHDRAIKLERRAYALFALATLSASIISLVFDYLSHEKGMLLILKL